jgi:hypothetical protein
MTHDRR